MDFGIFGDENALAKDTVVLIVLSKREHETSYCGGCIGSKRQQDKMCIKKGCTIKAHKDHMWIFNIHLVSNMDQHVFICVKSKEDTMVWTATMIVYVVIKSN